MYTSVPQASKVRESALKNMVRTFFDGSAEQAISALLDDSSARLSDRELDRLARMIEQARKAGA